MLVENMKMSSTHMVKTYQNIVPVTWGSVRCTFHYLTALFIALLIVGAVYLAGENGRFYQQQDEQRSTNKCSNVDNNVSSCDLFSGKWVFDNMSYPLYKEEECTFMSDQLACHKFGRNDLDYQHWRWQPHHCDLPRSLFFPLRTYKLCVCVCCV